MQKIKKLSAWILSVVFVMAFAGCALVPGASAPSKSPEETLKESVSNVYSIYAGGYDLSLVGKSTGATPEESFDFDLSLSGIFDTQEKTAPKFTVAADAKIKSGAEPEVLLGAELRLTKDFLYGVLSKLESGETEVPEETKALLGQWYKMAIPEGTFTESPLPGGKDEDMTDYQKQMKALVAETNLFKESTYVGAETVAGVPTFHYTASLDKEAVKAFLTEAAKIEGTNLTETDIADIDTSLDSTTLTGDVWVGADDMIIRKAKGVLSMVAEGQVNVDITFELTLKDVNAAQTVAEPAEAKDFDPTVLFGAASMVQGDGTLPVQ